MKQVIKEKAGRKKKEHIHDAIEAIQMEQVAASKEKDQVLQSPPVGKPKCFGDGPQWRRKDEGRDEASIKHMNQNVDDDINMDQPPADMVTR